MDNSEFTPRLQQILTYYSLTASALAEKMGIGRSSISHIVSGRNKPSLEFVLHILETFDQVTFDWLMYGKGTFPKSNNPTPIKNSIDKTKIEKKETTLFDSSEDLFSNQNTLENISEINSGEIGTTPEQKNVYSTIERIVVFYANGKFKEYTP